MADVDTVWSALAHPARRRIVDVLRTGPALTGALHDRLARDGLAPSRFATQRHLQVLRDAGLVLVTERGRERLNAFNGSALYQATIGWLDATSRQHAAGLHALKHHLESPKETPMDIRHIDVAQRLDIAAAPDAVWSALVDDASAWWGFPYTLIEGRPEIVIEPRLGGLVRERLGEREALWGVISEIEPGVLLAWNGRMGMGDAATGTVTFTLSPSGDGTTVDLRHESIGAVGEGTQASYDHGWGDLLQRLRALVERGEKHGTAGSNAAPAQSAQ